MLFAITVTVLTGCPKTGFPPVVDPQPSERPAEAPGGSAIDNTLAGPAALPARALAKLGSPDAEVHYAARGEQRLLITRADGRWIALANQPVTLGDAPGGGAASLHPTAGGYVFLWTDYKDQDGGIWVIHLRSDGQIAEKKRLAGRTGAVVRWLESFETADGIGVVAETASGHGKSRLSFVRIDEPGETKRDTAPRTLEHAADHVRGWQLARSAADSVITWVEARSDSETGKVFARTLTPKLGDVRTILDSPSALADIQLSRDQKGYQIAWTDTRDGDPHIYGARLEASGETSTSPKPLLQPVGRQALVTLVGNPAHTQTLLAWERPGQTGSLRSIRLQLLDTHSKRRPERAMLEFHNNDGLPQFAAHEDGYVALTLGASGQDDEDNTETTIVPSYVRFDQALKVTGGEPIRVQAFAADNGFPAVVRRLRCKGLRCTLLGRGRSTPSTLVEIELPARNSTYRANATTLSGPPTSELTSLRSVVTLDQPLADMDSVELADGRSLVAWITHVTAEADGKPRPAPAGATLAYRFVSALGEPGPSHVLSRRAISLGGVSLVAVDGKNSSKRNSTVAVLAWAGPAQGASQVYVTKISGRGKKLRQTTVTKIRRPRKKSVPNEVADVVLARDPRDGYVVAWSDTRDGQAEIYAARLSNGLDKRALEKRVTKSPTHAHEPSLLVTTDEVLIAWSQSDATTASVHVRALHRQSLRGKTPARSLLPPWDPTKTKTRQRSTKLTPHGKRGAILAYINEAAPTTQATTSRASLTLVQLGPGANVIGSKTIAGPSALKVNSFTIGCDTARCRGIVFEIPATSEDPGRSPLHVRGFTLAANESLKTSQPRALILDTLSRGSQQDVGLNGASPALNRLFFIEAQAGGSTVRSLQLRW